MMVEFICPICGQSVQGEKCGCCREATLVMDCAKVTQPVSADGAISEGLPPIEYAVPSIRNEISARRFHIRRLLLFSSACSLGSIFVASFLPIWTLWYENPWEGVGYHVSLWQLIWETLVVPPVINPQFPTTTTGDMLDVALAASIFLGGAFAGCIAYLMKIAIGRRSA